MNGNRERHEVKQPDYPVFNPIASAVTDRGSCVSSPRFSCSVSVAGEQYPEEERAAEQVGDDANRDWRHDASGKRVTRDEEHAAEQRRCRGEPAMVGANEKAANMRDDQADETDRPAYGNNAADKQ